MNTIKYLVFSGSGAAIYAHAGAILQLGKEPGFSFEKIKGVAGASAGAIAALLVSLGYSSEEISKKLSTIDLKIVQDGGNIFNKIYRLFSQYGIYKGEALHALINGFIKEKTGRSDPENVTFADLKKMGFKDLYVVATRIYKENSKPTGKQKVFCFDKTPDTSVSSAILASTAAPYYFRRVRLRKVAKGHYVFDDKNGDLYDDGGLINNFPIDIFDKPKFISNQVPQNDDMFVNPHTLGLVLLKTNEIIDQFHPVVKTPLADNKPIDYAIGIFNTLLQKYEKENLEKKENRERTIQIDRLDVGLGDFNIDKKTIQALLESGKNAVIAYLALNVEEKSAVEQIVEVGKLWKSSREQEPVGEVEVENERKQLAI